MLEGLEISIIKKSELDGIQNRLDSEFYSKKYVEFENKLEEQGYRSLADFNAQLDCSAFYPAITDYYNFEGRGIPFIRVNEIQDGMIQITESTAFLPHFVVELNSKTITKTYPNDIVIAKGGNTLAKVGIVTDKYPEYAVCRDVIVLRTHCIPENIRYFIWAFMHSDYGYDSMIRTASQTGQPHLTLPFISNLRIPLMSNDFYNKIKECYIKATNIQDDANRVYLEANNDLTKELRLHLMDKNIDSTKILPFKNSFLDNSRIDAEYYMPLYKSYENLVKCYYNGADSIGNLCVIRDGNILPEAKQEYKYIELSNIGEYGNITVSSIGIGAELPTRARRKVKLGDVIVSSIEGSLESCAIVTNEYREALCSTGFYVIRSSFFNPETLLLLFKSEPIQMLMKKGCSGTILTAISKSEIEKIPLPLISEEVQEQIAQKVQESFRLRNESKHLLGVAKKAVEIAISDNEEKAIQFIKESEDGKSLYN